jgi:hypothetical protein
MIDYSKGGFAKRMLGVMGVTACLYALLLINARPIAAAEPTARHEQLPYAPPPVMGFGNVLCAPVFTCAPAQQANGAPTLSGESKTLSGQQKLLYEQTRPQREIPFVPADFDKYAGYYEFAFPDGNVFVRVYRQENRYYWQVENAGQPPTELFPESPAEFFATEFAAQLSFVTATDGRVTELILHETGVQHMARRVPEATFDDWLEKLQSRMNAHEPSTRTDVALRRQLEAWERMGSDNPEVRVPIVRTIEGLGPLQGLKFIKAGPHGMDVYEVTFSKGELRCFITPLTSAGKVNALECHDIRPGT